MKEDLICGVCKDLAQMVGIDPLFVRLTFIGLFLWTSLPIAIIYVVLALIL